MPMIEIGCLGISSVVLCHLSMTSRASSGTATLYSNGGVV